MIVIKEVFKAMIICIAWYESKITRFHLISEVEKDTLKIPRGD